MAYYTKDSIKALNDSAHIQDVVNKFVKINTKGKNPTCGCPLCETKDKATITTGKNIITCWKCDNSGKSSCHGPLRYLQEVQKMEFAEALKWLDGMYPGILVEEADAEPAKKPSAPAKKKPAAAKSAPKVRVERQKPTLRKKGESFRDEQLRLSGLTNDDQVTMLDIGEEAKKEFDRYQCGTFNDRFEVVAGDDMVMHYVGLDRQPMTYIKKGSSKPRPLVRVRHQEPGLHLSRKGDPMKYQSPPGSSGAVWLPEWIIRCYERGTHIPTLFIQEGEKKADRCCKAGISSVGVMGIHNIATQERLPYEFQLIIKKCTVKNVVFVLDSDWLDLSRNLEKSADNRPRTFLSAVSKFRQYFSRFEHNAITLNIFFGHVNENTAGAKGMDDLIESDLVADDKVFQRDVEKALSPDASGKFVTFYDITDKPYAKLAPYWHLQTVEAFGKYYKEILSERDRFTYRGHSWKFDASGNVVSAQPFDQTEQFWQETEGRHGETKVNFDHSNAYNFLGNRGFGRLQRHGNNFIFIREEEKVIREVEPYQVKDFAINFLKVHKPKDKEVHNAMYRGAKFFFGQDSLSNLEFIKPSFHKNGPGVQHMYFKETFWTITKDKILEREVSEVNGHVWEEKLNNFSAKCLDAPLVSMQKITAETVEALPEGKKKDAMANFIGSYTVSTSAEAGDCEFLDFLLKTSDFYWRKAEDHLEDPKKNAAVSLEEQLEIQQHLLAKMTAIGHMLHGYRDAHNEYAIVGLEGDLVDGGRSEGGTGKSLIGKAMKQMVPTVTINGKKSNLMEDQFLFGEVTERTDLVIIDDLNRNFDLQFLFPNITGDFFVRPVGQPGFTISYDESPKLYLTTNFYPKTFGRSYTRRMRKVAFSDYFNNDREPQDVYGKLFFDDWEHDQWNLYYNLMANCLQLYFQHGGVIEAPEKRLELRRLQQEMGDLFVDWADSVFQVPDSPALGIRVERLAIYETEDWAFLKRYPQQKKWVNERTFKRKLWLYCLFRGFIINAGKPCKAPRMPEYEGLPYGGDDKAGGKEYFQITKPDAQLQNAGVDDDLPF